MTDFGSVSIFDASWPHASAVACGQHFPAMGMKSDERFSEYDSKNSDYCVTVLKVGGSRPQLPPKSVMHNEISRWYKAGWKSEIITLKNGMRCKKMWRNRGPTKNTSKVKNNGKGNGNGKGKGNGNGKGKGKGK